MLHFRPRTLVVLRGVLVFRTNHLDSVSRKQMSIALNRTGKEVPINMFVSLQKKNLFCR